MVKYMDSCGYDKLNVDKKKVIDKASKKLQSQIKGLGLDRFNDFIINNPIIHDSYGTFYVYKYSCKGYSVRLLYRYANHSIEIHMFHFKQGDSDNSKYIEVFESYANSFQEG